MSRYENEATPVSNNPHNEQLQFFRLHHRYYRAGNIRNCISVEQLQCFKDKTINLQWCKLQHEDVECVAAFVTSSSYKEWHEINMSNCGIRDHIYKMCCKLSKHNDVTIKVLQLNNNHINGVYTSWLSKIVINNKVRKLWINGNDAIGENKQFYYAVLMNPSTQLEVLHMSDVGLSSNSAISLFKALASNSTLKELVITSNNVNDDACETITTMLKKNNCLTKLWIWKNPISDMASKFILDALIDNTSLERLGLPCYNDPTERTIKSSQETVNKQRKSHGCQVPLLVDFM